MSRGSLTFSKFDDAQDKGDWIRSSCTQTKQLFMMEGHRNCRLHYLTSGYLLINGNTQGMQKSEMLHRSVPERVLDNAYKEAFSHSHSLSARQLINKSVNLLPHSLGQNESGTLYKVCMYKYILICLYFFIKILGVNKEIYEVIILFLS